MPQVRDIFRGIIERPGQRPEDVRLTGEFNTGISVSELQEILTAPSDEFQITNLYVDATTENLVVEYDDGT